MTSGGRCRRRGQLALDVEALAAAVDRRDRREQRLRVRMPGRAEHLADSPALHDPPEVHHRDLVGEILDHGEVVGDEEIREPEVALQRA